MTSSAPQNNVTNLPVRKFGSVYRNVAIFGLVIMLAGILSAMKRFLPKPRLLTEKHLPARRSNGWKSHPIFSIYLSGNNHFLITMRPTLILLVQKAGLMKSKASSKGGCVTFRSAGLVLNGASRSPVTRIM